MCEPASHVSQEDTTRTEQSIYNRIHNNGKGNADCSVKVGTHEGTGLRDLFQGLKHAVGFTRWDKSREQVS